MVVGRLERILTKVVIGALAGAMTFTMVPSHAGGAATVTYLAAPGTRISDPSVPAGVGGYYFETPSKPLTLDVDDLNGNGVRVTVCQENAFDPVAGDLEEVCGDGGDDVRVSYCTNGNPKNIGVNDFKPNSPFDVFVRTDGPALGCAQVGVGGTMVLTW